MEGRVDDGIRVSVTEEFYVVEGSINKAQDPHGK